MLAHTDSQMGLVFLIELRVEVQSHQKGLGGQAHKIILQGHLVVLLDGIWVTQSHGIAQSYFCRSPHLTL